MNKGAESKNKMPEKKKKQDQQKRTSLLSEIANLEQIPDRTPQQEQELKQKKQELAELEEKNRKGQDKNLVKDKNLGLKIVLGIGAVGLLVLVVIAIVVKRSKRNN